MNEGRSALVVWSVMQMGISTNGRGRKEPLIGANKGIIKQCSPIN